jgi:hypothetical protein
VTREEVDGRRLGRCRAGFESPAPDPWQTGTRRGRLTKGRSRSATCPHYHKILTAGGNTFNRISWNFENIKFITENQPMLNCVYILYSREVDFWIIRIFNFLQLNLDWQKKRIFYFISMASYAVMSLWGPKKEKKSLNRVPIWVFKWVNIGTTNP